MSKINTVAVKENIIEMLGDLKALVEIYTSDNKEVSTIEGNESWTREHKDGQIGRVREKTKDAASKRFEEMQKHFEALAEVLRANDNVYDFSNPEFSSCIALMSASAKQLPIETILGITEKFLGNRQALLALAEIAKGPNEETIRKHILNTETEIENLQEKMISLEVGFPGNIIALPSFKDALIRILKSCGEELTDQEKNLGTDYQDIVNMQIRAAFGL